jgi:hypothetical protein
MRSTKHYKITLSMYGFAASSRLRSTLGFARVSFSGHGSGNHKEPDDAVFTWENADPVKDFRVAWDKMCSEAKSTRTIFGAQQSEIWYVQG